MCPNFRFLCQKQITLTPNQYQLEGVGFKKYNWKLVLRGSKKKWNRFIRCGLKKTSPINSAGATGKTKNPQVGEVSSFFSRSKTGGKNYSLTDMSGNGLGLKVFSLFIKLDEYKKCKKCEIE